MKVEIAPRVYPQRGGDVVIGNVYANNRAPAFRDFRIVVGIADTRNGRTPWNKIVLIHVDAKGDVVGSSNQPEQYVRNHWDLIGRVNDMPTMKIEWLRENER